jgi:hypothetical protein
MADGGDCKPVACQGPARWHKAHGGSLGKSILWAAKTACMQRQPRVSNDTPNTDALAIVAATVRFNSLDILFTPAFDFAIVFKVRTSSLDHGRRNTTFVFFISVPFF